MDYSKLKVNDLRALCKERGIQYPNDAHKADMVAMLSEADSSPEEVQAEVIDDESGLSITYNIGEIQANFEALNAQVDALLAKYDGYVPDPDDAESVKQCARERKYLNSIARGLDERRKSVKREYEKPLKAFEEQANAVRDKIKRVSARLKAIEDESDQARRDWLYGNLQEHYEAYAGLLLDVVPYSKIHEDKWLNKTFGEVKAQAEIEAKVDKIASDWEALKALGLPNQQQAEVRFFACLNLGDAVSYARKMREDAEKIEALKAEMQDPMTMEPEHVPVVPQPEPAPMPPAPQAPTQGDSPKPRVMVIDAATLEQCKAIGRFCGSIGVTGTFKTGTLAEVAARG